MHELIQSMAREIMREEFRQNHRRLWILSEDYDVLNLNQVTEEVEVLVLLLKKNCQNIPIDGQAITRMKNLRILKICFSKIEGRWQPFAVNFPGRMDSLSNNLRLLYWHGLPLESLPLDFYPEKIVTIDLSYSHIKHLWTTSKCFPRLKFMKLRYCIYLTSTPDFTDIANLEKLILEGCKNLVKVHPSVGILKKLLVLNMRDCTCLKSFPSNLQMDSLQILILSGCLKLDKLPEDLGRITSLKELHVNRTAITELPSYVSSLTNLESLSFGGQGRVQPRWWTSITSPFGLVSKQQHPQRSIPSLAGLHMLKFLNLSYCNLEQVPEGIGGLSCLKELNLEGNNLLEVPESIGGLSCLKKLNLDRNNLFEVPESIGGLSCLEKLYLEENNFSSLPGSLSQLSHLRELYVDGCKKLEVLPNFPPSLHGLNARDCTSLCSITGTCCYIDLTNCPKLFTNLAIDSHLSTSATQYLDSPTASLATTNRFYSFRQYADIQDNRCILFHCPGLSIENMDIIYPGNSIPEWFTNKSMGNNVKVELPSDWCYDKFRGFGTCVVFKRKIPRASTGYSIKNFDGSSLGGCRYFVKDHFGGQPTRITQPYMVWLHHTWNTSEWKEAKNAVTFCFDDEDVEVKEFGARLICDGDLEQDVTNSIITWWGHEFVHGGWSPKRL